MNQLTQIPDLSFSLNRDGSIDLEQSAGCGEVGRISLHSCHIRYLFECAGHLLPPTPADELTKRLAVQLCELRDGLLQEIGRSPGIDGLHRQATAATDMLPDSLYPHWLYAEETTSEQAKQEVERPDFQLTHPTTKEQQR